MQPFCFLLALGEKEIDENGRKGSHFQTKAITWTENIYIFHISNNPVGPSQFISLQASSPNIVHIK